MNEIQKITPEDFPPLLKEINEPPNFLYKKGDIPKNTKLLTIVGARSHSEYGKRVCQKLIYELAGYPITIISGLAIGIDSIAHKAAMENGLKTIAVLGSGLDNSVIYPRVNINLAKEIVKKDGCLISEMKAFARPNKYSFPARNRIMAGMSDAIIVIECKKRSGTKITARLGLEYGRDVCAVPQTIFTETGKGVNELLQEGAHLVQSGSDILDILNLNQDRNLFVQERIKLKDYEKKIFKLLNKPLTPQTISQKTELPMYLIFSALSSLRMHGLIKENLNFVSRNKRFINMNLKRS